MTSRPSLVNRRFTQTRREIVEAALSLFVDNGFDETTMSEIAESAGVSRRTIYRYFATKDDIVFESPREWLQIFNGVIETRREDESTRDVFLRALIEVGNHIQASRERVVREFSVLVSSPSLQARHGRSDAEWVERYIELLAPDVEGDPDGELTATVAAMALVAAQNALIAVWAAGSEDHHLAEMAVSAIGQLESVWPPGSR